MATKILLKKSLTGGSVPVSGDIDAGEIAINLVDRKVYSKNGGGAVIRMDGAYVDGSAPANPVEGDIWYDTANNLLKAHNGTGFVSAGYQTIAALEDTTITSATDGEFLIYDNATSKWINGTHAEADVQKASTLETDVEALFSVTDAGGDGSLAYSAGVFTYTGPSAAEARAHFSGANGISLTNGAIALDFTEFDTGDITENTNLFYTNERVDDRVAALVVGGTNMTVTYDDAAGTLTLDAAAAGGFDLSNNDTDDLSEGTTNKYFSNTLARGAVSVTDAGGDGSLSYASASGIITYTGPSASETRAHFAGGTGVTITNGSVAIGQSVGTGDNVEFNKVTTDNIDGDGTSITLDPSADGTNNGTVIVAGNLTVNGTTTSVNSNEVNIGDAIIVLNADETGTPSQDAGIEIERGTGTNKVFMWNESDTAWDLGGEVMQNIELDGGSY
jgi:co-chaperonin GroES (HSP10)